MRTSLYPLAPALAFFVCAGMAEAVPVTECGQLVEEPGVLTADLDCSAFPGDALIIRRGVGRARLSLNGFTLTGNDDTDPHSFSAVHCSGRCRLEGPGLITGATSGVIATLGTVGSRQVKPRLKIRDVTFAVTGTGVVSGSATGVAILNRCTITGGTGGVWGYRRVKLRNSTITDNSIYGVRVLDGRASIKNSSVAGNATDVVLCGTDSIVCADIISLKKPRVSATSVCETSHNLATGGTWAVCSDD